jgi:uncharacterized protein (TIGR00255 family)
MKSMTGFACAEENVGDAVVIVEIRGCNSKYSEFNISIPNQFLKFENDMRRLISSYCGRGKVDVNIRIKNEQQNQKISVNENAVHAYIEACGKIVNAINAEYSDATEGGEEHVPQFDKTIRIYDLLSLAGVLEVETDSCAEYEKWDLVRPVFIKVLEKFNLEREREGANTEENILSHITVLERSVKKIKQYVPELEAIIKKNIKERFEELKIDSIDENRILCETAILLMKYTIAEELSRLDSHLGEFRQEAKRNTSSGKKLDFLSQEIHREINTIGAKSYILEVSQLVVNMKDALENIREQLRNVE